MNIFKGEKHNLKTDGMRMRSTSCTMNILVFTTKLLGTHYQIVGFQSNFVYHVK